jgi:hypothetical protein
MEVGKNVLEVTEEKQLRWFGHVKRIPGNRLPLIILEWEPEGKRRRGRPKERWIDGVRRSKYQIRKDYIFLNGYYYHYVHILCKRMLYSTVCFRNNKISSYRKE